MGPGRWALIIGDWPRVSAKEANIAVQWHLYHVWLLVWGSNSDSQFKPIIAYPCDDAVRKVVISTGEAFDLTACMVDFFITSVLILLVGVYSCSSTGETRGRVWFRRVDFQGILCRKENLWAILRHRYWWPRARDTSSSQTLYCRSCF